MNSEVKLPWISQAHGQPPKPIPKNEWGPRGWAWLHTHAINFPVGPTRSDQNAMFARFWSFIQTLPCPECRFHATRYIQAYPPDFSGSAGFQTWAWRFHNAVNYRLGKRLVSAENYRTIYREEISMSYWGCV